MARVVNSAAMPCLDASETKDPPSAFSYPDEFANLKEKGDAASIDQISLYKHEEDQRNAVIHAVNCFPQRSRHTQKIVRSFRQGHGLQ